MHDIPPILLLDEVASDEETSSVETMCAVDTDQSKGVLVEEGLTHLNENIHLLFSRGFTITGKMKGLVRQRIWSDGVINKHMS